MDESVSKEPYILKGRLIDLFDPQLPVVHEKVVNPGEQAYMLNIDRVKNLKKPQVLAAASRVYNEKVTKTSYSFITKSPLNTSNVMRILLPSKPATCTITDAAGNKLADASWNWDNESKTCKVTFENNPEGVKVQIKW